MVEFLVEILSLLIHIFEFLVILAMVVVIIIVISLLISNRLFA